MMGEGCDAGKKSRTVVADKDCDISRKGKKGLLPQ